MESQFLQTWLAATSREIDQITPNSDSLCWLKFKNGESEPYTKDFILRIPLYCKYFEDGYIWLKDCWSASMKL